MQAHMHLGGGKWEMVAFGKRLGALVGGFQHGQQRDIQMETVYTQYQDACGKKIGFLRKDSRAVCFKIVPFTCNQSGNHTDR